MNILIASNNPVHHILDQAILGGPNPLFGSPSNFPLITMHMVTLTFSAILALFVLRIATKSIANNKKGTEKWVPKNRIGQLIEVVVLYLRDQTIKPVLGHDTNKFLPYLLSLFFFILFNNLMGLVPWMDLQHFITGKGISLIADTPNGIALFGGTATSNISVTIGLAIFSFIAIQSHGISSLGIKGWAQHFTGGAPLFLLPIMLPIEILGLFMKPAALAIRLFANMVAGHTLMATLSLFGLMAVEAGQSILVTGGISFAGIAAAVPITFLELFVAFLQAFIFMFLTTVFISQMSHHDESHEHGKENHAVV